MIFSDCHPWTLLSSWMSSDDSEIWQTKFNDLIDNVNNYNSIVKSLYWLDIDDSYTFQKFESEDDGFKVWHQEHGPGALSKRFLVWMFYLNNAQSGTDFKYFPTTPPKVGRCVVWPAGFPYIHRSHPNKGLKFIVSGIVQAVGCDRCKIDTIYTSSRNLLQ